MGINRADFGVWFARILGISYIEFCAVAAAFAMESGGATYEAPWYAQKSLAGEIESRAASHPEDPAVLLEIAEGTLALAMRAPDTYADPRTAKVLSRHLCEEARRCATEAEAKGAKGWRLDTVIALATYYSGSPERLSSCRLRSFRRVPGGCSQRITTNGGVAQLVRACGSYPQCPGFKSLYRHQY